MPHRSPYSRSVRHRLFFERLESRHVLAYGPLAAEFSVDLDAGDTQPRLARNALGDTVVVWSRGGQESFARSYMPDGTERGPAVRLIETPANYRQTFHDVAHDAANFYVLYQLDTQSSSSTSPDHGLYVQRFDVQGIKLGTPLIVVESEDTSDPSAFPFFVPGNSARLAANGSGSLVVVFEAMHRLTPPDATTLGTSEKGIFARRFSGGTVDGNPILVQLDASPGTGFVHALPDVDMDQEGKFTVVWTERTALDSANVLARQYGEFLSPSGPSFAVSTTIPDNTPSISMSDSGTFVVTWSAPDANAAGVFAQAYSPLGAALAPEPFLVNADTAGSQFQPTVQVDVDANGFVIAWRGPRELTSPAGVHGKISGQQYRFAYDDEKRDPPTAVVPVGGNFLVNPSLVSGQGSANGSAMPAIAGDSCGNLAVAWIAQSGPNSGVWTRRYAEDTRAGLTLAHDSDGDALPDCWELEGVTVNVSGVDRRLPLPEMGADPLRKDIFVEVDFMGANDEAGQPSGFDSHEPKDAAMLFVRQAFQNAPVMNPDGSTGITLHIDHGSHAPMHPGDDGIWNTFDDARWGNLSGANELPFAEMHGEVDGSGNYKWKAFDVIKEGPDELPRTADDGFAAERWPAFHYAQFVHLFDEERSSGISRNSDVNFFGGAGNFLVSLGDFTGGVGTVAEQAGTFMHELGHNLGLAHGGGDHINDKPNYLSVMSYAFQMKGLIADRGEGRGYVNHFDYSGFDLDDLNEQGGLSESTGLTELAAMPRRGFDPNLYGTRHACGPNNQQDWLASTASVDWNCDGDVSDSSVSADINGDGVRSQLTGHDDWSNLVFKGGGIGSLGAGLDDPAETPIDEATPEDVHQGPVPVDIVVTGGGTQRTSAGMTLSLSYVVQNLGIAAAVLDLEVTSLLGWVDAGSAPMTVNLAANESTPISITVNVPADADFDERDRVTLIATNQTDTAIFDTATVAIELLGFDLGDAPTAAQSGLASDYPVTLARDGARHPVGALRLGAAIDAEADGQPDDVAGQDGSGGDDDRDVDDEDGVKFLATLIATSGSATKASAAVTSSGTGKVDAWIDFNRDGDWDDAGEQLFPASFDVVAGANLVTFTVPAGASTGLTYARFRLSSAGGLQPGGLADDGEVEDYAVSILDGDAGADATLDLTVGAVQIAAEGGVIVVRLTSQAATELFRAPGDVLASTRFLRTPGDDTLAIGNLTSALAAPIPLIFDGGAGRDTLMLSGSDQELDLTNTTLNQLANLEVLDIVGNSPNKLIVTEAGVVAAAAAGQKLLVLHDEDDTVEYRGRWDVLAPTFAGGEFVHVVRQGAATLHVANTLPWQNPINKLDANFDGFVSPIDALVDINTINESGSRLLPTPTPDNIPEFYYDSSGDQFVSPVDALQIINFLNQPHGEGETVPTEELLVGERFAALPLNQSPRFDVSSRSNQTSRVLAPNSTDRPISTPPVGVPLPNISYSRDFVRVTRGRRKIDTPWESREWEYMLDVLASARELAPGRDS